MIVLQIEHPVLDFNDWKKAFDDDPLHREQSGVRRYKIFRLADDPNYVIVELEFDDTILAEGMLSALQKFWNQFEGIIMMSPKTRIFELSEGKEY